MTVFFFLNYFSKLESVVLNDRFCCSGHELTDLDFQQLKQVFTLSFSFRTFRYLLLNNLPLRDWLIFLHLVRNLLKSTFVTLSTKSRTSTDKTGH